VHKIIIPLHPANAALVAVVVISLNPVVKEVAHGAKICGELNAASNACVGHGLSFITRSAHHFFDRMPVNFMTLGIVVAVTTPIYVSTTRGDQAASAHVVRATNAINLLLFFFFGHIWVNINKYVIMHLNDFRMYYI
jgi:hypothetical protein